jgi:hypothetical protein
MRPRDRHPQCADRVGLPVTFGEPRRRSVYTIQAAARGANLHSTRAARVPTRLTSARRYFFSSGR